MNTFETFLKLHQQDKPLLLPNAWDAASARIFEDAGGAAIATTSAGVSWSQGYADGSKMPAAANASVAKSIARVIRVPLTVDFEDGYSDDPNVVANNIKPLLDIGVAGINIEDGKNSPDLLSKKIEAIKNAVASHGSKLFINVRTDVYLASLVSTADMVSETIRRGKQYAAAGADGFFVPVITKEEEIALVVNSVPLPLNVLAVQGLAKADRLAALGVKRLSAGIGISTIVWHTAARLAKAFLSGGDPAVFKEESMPGVTLQQLFAPGD
jgi:2-methylisocitrate lyase-like PEP mutase family enzyme